MEEATMHKYNTILFFILLSAINALSADNSPSVNKRGKHNDMQDTTQVMIRKNSIVVASTLAVLSTDLTNLGKDGDYKIYSDVKDTTFKQSIGNLENRNLCELKGFKKAVGDFTCSKNIAYTITYNSSEADVYITDNPEIFMNGKKLFVYIGTKIENTEFPLRFNITNNKRIPEITLDKEKLKEQGFVPDPMLKISK